LQGDKHSIFIINFGGTGELCKRESLVEAQRMGTVATKIVGGKHTFALN